MVVQVEGSKSTAEKPRPWIEVFMRDQEHIAFDRLEWMDGFMQPMPSNWDKGLLN